MSRPALTVGALRSFLKKVDPETEVTFGSSKYRMRPLVFNQISAWSDQGILIELDELGPNCQPVSENESRETTASLLEKLSLWEDQIKISFGSSLDGLPLEFSSLEKVVAINLEQTREPEFFVAGD